MIFQVAYINDNSREDCISMVFTICLKVFVVLFSCSDAQLCLFGSSCNGFGFRNSDLDITLTFQGRKTDEVRNL